MSRLVIDSSVAAKWVAIEEGSQEALSLRQRAKLIAPELLVAEFTNFLWKKIRRGELTEHEARLGLRLLKSADIELVSLRVVLDAALRLAVDLEHPAYDCFFVALAVQNDCHFVTADARLIAKIRQSAPVAVRNRVVTLVEAATMTF